MSEPMTCCDSFAAACESGTDAEGYSALIRNNPRGESCDFVGINNPTIQFCPWCGADKRVGHPVEVAARRVVDCMYGHPREYGDLKNAVAALSDVLDKHKGAR